jgi:hypothetical protein
VGLPPTEHASLRWTHSFSETRFARESSAWIGAPLEALAKKPQRETASREKDEEVFTEEGLFGEITPISLLDQWRREGFGHLNLQMALQLAENTLPLMPLVP